MGEEAIDQQKDNSDDLGKDLPDADESGSSPDEHGDGKSPNEAEEVQIVLTDGDGSQPEKERINRIVNAKVNKLNRRNKASTLQSSKTIEMLEQENRLLKLSLDQKSEVAPAKMPDPNQFDDGVSDVNYLKAHAEYTDGRIAEAVRKIPQQETPQQQDHVLERKQRQHYERAEDLGVAGYGEVEGKAIDVLGLDAANVIIRSNANSHKILYHLGKNLEKAEYFADLAKSDPVACVMEIGDLGGKLSAVRQKSNMNQAPDPDNELEGASPTTTNAYELKLDKLRTRAAETGDMKALMEFKRKHQEKARA